MVDLNNDDIENANSVSTDKINFGEFSATLEKTTDQSISSGTDTTVDWDSQDVDTDVYSYDSGADTLDVLKEGDYRVEVHSRIDTGSDQDLMQVKVFLNGTDVRFGEVRASGTEGSPKLSILLKGLAANDTLRFDVRDNNSNANVFGDSRVTYAAVSKEA